MAKRAKAGLVPAGEADYPGLLARISTLELAEGDRTPARIHQLSRSPAGDDALLELEVLGPEPHSRVAGDPWIVERIKLENGPTTILRTNGLAFWNDLIEIIILKIAVVIRKYQ